MRKELIFIIAVQLIILLSSCAERNDPVVPDEEFALELVSQTQTPGWAQDVWIHGSQAMIADGEQGVTFWDITNPSSPSWVDTFRTTEEANLVTYLPMNNFLLVGEGSRINGLTMYDYDTKEYKKRVFDDYLEDYGFVEIAADTMIIAEVDRTEGFKVFTVFYDTTFGYWDDEMYRGVQTLGGTARGLVFKETMAYIANNQLGLTIASIEYTAVTNAITILSTTDTPGAAQDVALNGSGTHALVADYQAGFSIMDVTDPNMPELVTTLRPDGVDGAFKVVAVGDTAYFLDRYNGMFAVDVSNVQHPEVIGRYDTPTPTSIFVTEDHMIYMTDEDLGLLVFRWRG